MDTTTNGELDLTQRVKRWRREKLVLPLYDAAAIVPRHLEALAAENLRPNTIIQRRRVLRRLQRAFPNIDLTKMTYDHLMTFLNRPGITPSSRYTELTHLRPFYRWCLLEGLRDHDPTLRIKLPKRRRRFPRPIADDQLELALDHAEPRRVKPALYLAAYAGLRACEIAPLQRRDFRDGVILIREQKGGDAGQVPLSPLLEQALSSCELPSSSWFFPYFNGSDGHLPAHMISKVCNEYLHAIGISKTLHTLRHWFGTNTYQVSDRDIRQTQELLRHRNLASTQIYTWVDPDKGASILNQLPKFGSTSGS